MLNSPDEFLSVVSNLWFTFKIRRRRQIPFQTHAVL